MSCKKWWKKIVAVLLQVTRIAPESVNGTLRCPRCQRPLRKDGTCVMGHAQAGLGAVGRELASAARIVTTQLSTQMETARVLTGTIPYGAITTPDAKPLREYVQGAVEGALRQLVLATVGEHIGHAEHAAKDRRIQRRRRRGPAAPPAGQGAEQGAVPPGGAMDDVAVTVLRSAIAGCVTEVRDGGRPWAEVGHELGRLAEQAAQQGQPGLVQEATWWQAEAYCRVGTGWATMLGGYEGKTATPKTYLEKALEAATRSGHGRVAMDALLYLARVYLYGEGDPVGAQHYLASAQAVAEQLATVEGDPYASQRVDWQGDLAELTEETITRSGGAPPEVGTEPAAGAAE